MLTPDSVAQIGVKAYIEAILDILNPDILLYALPGDSQFSLYGSSTKYGTNTARGAVEHDVASIAFNGSTSYVNITALAPAAMPSSAILYTYFAFDDWSTPAGDEYIFRLLYTGAKDDLRLFRSSADGNIYARIETNNTVRTPTFSTSGLSGRQGILTAYNINDKGYLYLNGDEMATVTDLTDVAGDALSQMTIGALTQAPTSVADGDISIVAYKADATDHARIAKEIADIRA